MAQAGQNIPVTKEPSRQQPSATSADPWRPLSTLRRQIDHLLEDFDRMTPFWHGRSAMEVEPFWHGREMTGMNMNMPAVDIVEQDKAILISAELPGMDERNIELKLSNGTLMLRGEKKAEREEKTRGYYLSERSFGSFQRSFTLPDSVDPEKIEAQFDNGVLTITLPKRPEAQKPEKRIDIKPTHH